MLDTWAKIYLLYPVLVLLLGDSSYKSGTIAVMLASTKETSTNSQVGMNEKYPLTWHLVISPNWK